MSRVVVAAAIVDEPEVTGARAHVPAGTGDSPALLLAQRRYPDEVAGLWELPGGKVEPGETQAGALRREIAEEIGVVIEVGAHIGRPVPLRPDLSLVARRARIVSGTAQPLDHQAIIWVDAAELEKMAEAGELVPADTAWLPELVEVLTRRVPS